MESATESSCRCRRAARNSTYSAGYLLLAINRDLEEIHDKKMNRVYVFLFIALAI